MTKPLAAPLSQQMDEQIVREVYPEAFLFYVEQTFSESILCCSVLESPANRRILGSAQKERNGYEKDLSVAEAWADAATAIKPDVAAPLPEPTMKTEIQSLRRLIQLLRSDLAALTEELAERGYIDEP